MNAGHWVARRRALAEPVDARHAAGPRFDRFAAAMRATPPPSAQVLPETEAAPERSRHGPDAAPSAASAQPAAPPPQPPLRPAKPIEAAPPPVAFVQPSDETADADRDPPDFDGAAAAATVIPRRPVIEDAGRPRADIPWLGIGSWLLLCGALFASLVWPDHIALDRLTSLWPSEIFSGATLTRAPAPEDPGPPATSSPAHEQDWSPMLPDAAHAPQALPPTELAPPIRSEAPADTPGPADRGPPLPRFKPSVDRVAAKFSNAFFEIGDRLQQQGDFDAALHMRRQGTNLNSQKAPAASDL